MVGPILDVRRDAPEPRTSPHAIAAFVCAVLVLPLLATAAPLSLVARERGGVHVIRSYTKPDPDTGAPQYWVAYADPADGTRRELGPFARPVAQADLPEVPVTPRLVAFRAVSALVLGLPLVLEVAALVLGLSALARIAARPIVVTGRGLAVAALAVAALNVAGGLCLWLMLAFVAGG